MGTDLSYLLSMSEGDKSIISEMIDIFTVQIKEIASEMHRLESEKEYDKLSKLAHKAKSSVAIMGMNSLAQSLKELENLAKNSVNPETYKAYVVQFINETEQAVIELENYKKNHLVIQVEK